MPGSKYETSKYLRFHVDHKTFKRNPTKKFLGTYVRQFFSAEISSSP